MGLKLRPGLGLKLRLGSEVEPGVVAAAVISGKCSGAAWGRAVGRGGWTWWEVFV